MVRKFLYNSDTFAGYFSTDIISLLYRMLYEEKKDFVLYSQFLICFHNIYYLVRGIV